MSTKGGGGGGRRPLEAFYPLPLKKLRLRREIFWVVLGPKSGEKAVFWRFSSIFLDFFRFFPISPDFRGIFWKLGPQARKFLPPRPEGTPPPKKKISRAQVCV